MVQKEDYFSLRRLGRRNEKYFLFALLEGAWR
jgi:hypothetical protein